MGFDYIGIMFFVLLMAFFVVVPIIYADYVWKRDFPLTLPEYLEKYPESKTRNGIRCFSCSSKALKNWGVDGRNSKKRMVSCHHCSTNLYRIEG